MAKIPQPPLDRSNDSLYRTLKDLIGYVREITENGLALISYTQDEIDTFTDDLWEGRIVYNSTARKPYASYFDGVGIAWEELF
jgi:hypothetical protein